MMCRQFSNVFMCAYFQARKKLTPNTLKDLLLPVVPLDTSKLVTGIYAIMRVADY